MAGDHRDVSTEEGHRGSPDIRRIERSLARAVGTHAGHLRDGRSPVEGHVHRELSACLERLLQAHWLAAGLSRFRRFDGLVEASSEAVANDRFHVSGLMAWSEGRGGDQVDRFAADLRLGTDRQDLASYALRLGRHEVDGDRTRWAYVFRKSMQRSVHRSD